MLFDGNLVILLQFFSTKSSWCVQSGSLGYSLVQWGKDLWPFLCSPHGCLSFHWENSLYGENRVIVNHAYMLSFLSGFVICFSNDMLIEKQCTIWRIFSRCHCWLLVSMSPLGMQCRNLGVGHKGMKKKGIAQYFMIKWFILKFGLLQPLNISVWSNRLIQLLADVWMHCQMSRKPHLG